METLLVKDFLNGETLDIEKLSRQLTVGNIISIYVITCKKTTKNYIGQTSKSLKSRLSGHKKDAKHGRKGELYDDIRLYGIENFDIKLLASTSDPIEGQHLEELYIKQFNSINAGYNTYRSGKARINEKINYNPNSYKSFKQNTIIDFPIVAYKTKDDKYIEYFESVRLAAKLLKISSSNIYRVLSGKYSQTSGYYFNYIPFLREPNSLES